MSTNPTTTPLSDTIYGGGATDAEKRLCDAAPNLLDALQGLMYVTDVDRLNDEGNAAFQRAAAAVAEAT